MVFPQLSALPPYARVVGISVQTDLPNLPGARRAGPCEHGRQAARSERDRPGGQASRTTDSATTGAAQAALDP
jgi:hypothetical protein